jgi:hypothetical protein
MTAGELAAQFDLSWPTMSGHFTVLRAADLSPPTRSARRSRITNIGLALLEAFRISRSRDEPSALTIVSAVVGAILLLSAWAWFQLDRCLGMIHWGRRRTGTRARPSGSSCCRSCRRGRSSGSSWSSAAAPTSKSGKLYGDSSASLMLAAIDVVAVAAALGVELT